MEHISKMVDPSSLDQVDSNSKFKNATIFFDRVLLSL